MLEDEVGLGILTQYYGPIEQNGIVAVHRPLGTIEDTASLAELICPFRVELPDGIVVYAACIVEREVQRLERCE